MPAQTVARERKPRRKLSGYRTGLDAYGYLRVSTNSKTQLSLPDQKTICEEAAERQGYTIIGWYTDEKSRGVRRDGLHALLADIEDHENVGAVFFWQSSRLWGHIEQQRRIMYRAQRVGVRLIDGRGTHWKDDTPLEKLLNVIQSGANEYETNTTAERIHDTHSMKVASGQIIQRPPYGITVAKSFKDDGTIDSTFVVNNDEMDVVRRMFREYASGTPAYRIADALSKDGVRTRTDSFFTAANIRRTLDNKFYVGVMEWNKTKTEWEIDDVTGDKLKVVVLREDQDLKVGNSPLGCILADDPNDEDSVKEARALFEACADQRTSRGRERQKRVHDHRVLDGLVICGRCGYRMQARAFGHKIKGADGVMRKRNREELTFDYRCQHFTNANKGCSKSHTMTENQIFTKLATLLTDESDVRVVTWAPAKKSAAATAALVRRLSGMVERLGDERQRVLAGWRQGVYKDAAEYNVERDKVEGELAAAQAQLGEAQDEAGADTPHYGMTGAMKDLLLESLLLMRDSGIPLEDRREAAYRIFQEIRVDHPTVHAVLRQPSA